MNESKMEIITEQIIQAFVEHKRLFLVFDRDGTLVPYTEDPKHAILADSVRKILNKLAAQNNISIGILSARGLKQLRRDFYDGMQILAGNSGLEIQKQKQLTRRHPAAVAARDMLREAKIHLEEEILPSFPSILEDHGLSLCLHWQRTPIAFRPDLFKQLDLIRLKLPGLHFKEMPTSFEIWPAIEWDKACGLKEMLQILNLKAEETALLYAGDTEADLPALDFVKSKNGITIQIGRTSSDEHFHLESPQELHELLRKLESKLVPKQAI
ncbi:MAG: trehalose-phosphatase [Candidatus Obscuribacterales bacterium]|nr:trehalose-phosphatase [Candidatus Obscuribacterales bacterium]